MQTDIVESALDKNGKRVSRGARMRANRTYHPRHNTAARYSIHDRKQVARLLEIHHRLIADEYSKGKLVGEPMSLEDRLRQAAKRYLRRYGMLGRYMPHQGQREMERRRPGFYKLPKIPYYTEAY